LPSNIAGRSANTIGCRRLLAVLVTSGGDGAVAVARAATTTIPIVTTIGYDPVIGGLVKNLGRPDGNVTGVSVFASDLVPRRVEIVHELAPSAPTIAFLVNPTNPDSPLEKPRVEASAKALGQRVVRRYERMHAADGRNRERACSVRKMKSRADPYLGALSTSKSSTSPTCRHLRDHVRFER